MFSTASSATSYASWLLIGIPCSIVNLLLLQLLLLLKLELVL